MEKFSLEESVKSCLGDCLFDKTKEFFYHVNGDKYDFKIIVNDRTYLLFKMFSELVSDDINSVSYNGKIKEKYGVFLNSHSTNYIEHYLKTKCDNSTTLKILLVEDFIASWDRINDKYNLIKNLLDNYGINHDITIWCLGLDVDLFNQLYAFDIPKDCIKTYWEYNGCTLKKDTISVSDAIMNWNKGFSSYVNTYESEKNVDELIKLLSDDNSIIEKSKSSDISEYNCFISDCIDSIPSKKMFGNFGVHGISPYVEVYENNDYVSELNELTSKDNFDIEKYDGDDDSKYYCIFPECSSDKYIPLYRVYKKKDNVDGTLVVPFVYIKNVSRKDLMQVYRELDDMYHIGNIPACFNNIENNDLAAIHFYKWLTFVASSKMIENVCKEKNINIDVALSCNESFYGIADNEYYSDNESCHNIYEKKVSETVMEEMRMPNGMRLGYSLSDIMLKGNKVNQNKLLTMVFNEFDNGLSYSDVSSFEMSDGITIDTYMYSGNQMFKNFYDSSAKDFIALNYFIRNTYLYPEVDSLKELRTLLSEFDSIYNYNTRMIFDKLCRSTSTYILNDKDLLSDEIMGLQNYEEKLIKEDSDLSQSKLEAHQYVLDKYGYF